MEMGKYFENNKGWCFWGGARVEVGYKGELAEVGGIFRHFPVNQIKHHQIIPCIRRETAFSTGEAIGRVRECLICDYWGMVIGGLGPGAIARLVVLWNPPGIS